MKNMTDAICGAGYAYYSGPHDITLGIGVCVAPGADPAILKRGSQPRVKGGDSNYMLPFKCIDRPKKGGSTPVTPPSFGSASVLSLQCFI